jgi:transcriptional regulator with XRE-family HTH domain
MSRTPIHSEWHDALGRAVRETRARRGYSQEELGFVAGLHRNYVGAIERGEINPTVHALRKLEKGLRVPLSDLMGLAEQRLTEPGTPVKRRVRRTS